MFVYGPSLLAIGGYFRIILTTITAILGIFSLGFSLQGWLFNNINIYQRILLFLTALLLIKPGITTDLPGIIILCIAVIYRYRIHKKNQVK